MSLSPDSAMPGNGWRKSSFSGQDGNCAEIRSGPGTVMVRDTADRDGPAMAFRAAAWAAFMSSLKG